MGKKKTQVTRKELVASLREVRIQLRDINHKLDHLIKSYRKFYFTTDFSDSSHHEFKR